MDFSKYKTQSHCVSIVLFGSRACPTTRAYSGRNSYKGTFTKHTLPDHKAKVLLLADEDKIRKDLETRKNNIFLQRVGSRRVIARVWNRR
jgi:hypothetical protein